MAEPDDDLDSLLAYNFLGLFELAKSQKYAPVLAKCVAGYELRHDDLSDEEWQTFYEYMANFTDASMQQLSGILRSHNMYINRMSLFHIRNHDEKNHRVGNIRKIAMIMQDSNYLTPLDAQTPSTHEVNLGEARQCRYIYTNMVKFGITTPHILAGVTGIPVANIIAWANGTVNYHVTRTIAKLFTDALNIRE